MATAQGGNQDKKKKIQELQVLQSELKSLKEGARVYKQQPNSHIFFQDDRIKLFTESKKQLDDLIQEYKEAEKSGSEEQGEQEEKQTDKPHDVT